MKRNGLASSNVVWSILGTVRINNWPASLTTLIILATLPAAISPGRCLRQCLSCANRVRAISNALRRQTHGGRANYEAFVQSTYTTLAYTAEHKRLLITNRWLVCLPGGREPRGAPLGQSKCVQTTSPLLATHNPPSDARTSTPRSFDADALLARRRPILTPSLRLQGLSQWCQKFARFTSCKYHIPYQDKETGEENRQTWWAAEGWFIANSQCATCKDD